MTKYVPLPSPNGTNNAGLYFRAPEAAYDDKNGAPGKYTIYKRRRPVGHNLAVDEVDEEVSRKEAILKALRGVCDADELEAVRAALLGDDDDGERQEAMGDDDSIENHKAMDRYVTGRDLDNMSANMGARGGEMPVRGERESTAMDGSFYQLFPEAAIHRVKIDNMGLQPRADRQARRPLRGIEARPRMANDSPSSASVASFYELFPDAARIKKI